MICRRLTLNGKVDEKSTEFLTSVCQHNFILFGGEKHKENLERLSMYNIHMQLPKCEFLKDSTVFFFFLRCDALSRLPNKDYSHKGMEGKVFGVNVT